MKLNNEKSIKLINNTALVRLRLPELCLVDDSLITLVGYSEPAYGAWLHRLLSIAVFIAHCRVDQL